ncbi:hypothetical protein D9M71_663310 [compost metagenome]
MITCSRSGLITAVRSGSNTTRCIRLGGTSYLPSSRSWLMVSRIRVGERRMLLSVSMSASDGGMNLSVSWARAVLVSLWDSFFDCTITSAVISKLCLSTRGNSKAITANTRKTRFTNWRLAKKILKNSCR